MVPHPLHGRCVALIDVHTTNRTTKSGVGEIWVLLAADRVVKHKDASSPSPGQRQLSSPWSQFTLAILGLEFVDLHIFQQLLRLGVIGILDLVFVDKLDLLALVVDDLEAVAIQSVLGLASSNVGHFHIYPHRGPGLYLLRERPTSGCKTLARLLAVRGI